MLKTPILEEKPTANRKDPMIVNYDEYLFEVILLSDDISINLRWTVTYVAIFLPLYFLTMYAWGKFFLDVVKDGKTWQLLLVATVIILVIVITKVTIDVCPYGSLIVKQFYIVLVSTALNGLSSCVCSYLHVPGTALYDVLFHTIPEIPSSSSLFLITDVMAVMLFSSLFLLIFFLPDNRRAHLLLSAARLSSIIYLLRASSLFWTILPGPGSHCRPGAFTGPQFGSWVEVVGHISPTYGIMKNCGDLIFSGHTAGSFVWLYCIISELPKRFKSTGLIISYIYMIVLIYFIIAGRKHYTIDIVIALIVSYYTCHVFNESWTPIGYRKNKKNQIDF